MDTEISSDAAVAIDMINKEKTLSNSNSKRSSNTNKTEKRVLDPHGKFVLICNGIFFWSSIIAVSTDPMFLYIPIIKEHKCLGIDKKMVIVSLVLRSITDLFYILHIVFRIVQAWDAYDHHKTIKNGSSPSWLKLVLNVINDILAVLPLPQVIILCFLSKMTSSKYSWDKANPRIILSIMVFLQYAPRTIRILILYNTLKWHNLNRVFNTWVQSILYILLYLIASHVGGGFYHLLSIERETTCWYQVCQNHRDECIDLRVFECGPDHQPNMSNNNLTTFVNSFCYDYNNPKAFDLGVFRMAIKSNILGSTNIPNKFIQTIWWGLRHMSTFGQNLDPTTGTLLEVGFVACVFIFGLLLFIFFIGTVQTFMQMESTKSVNVRLKMISKEREVKLWVEKHFLSSEVETIIMQKMQSNLTNLRKDHLDVEEVVDSLPLKDKIPIMRHISYSTLRRVPLLRNKENINDQVLEDFIKKTKLVSYKEHKYIVRKGEPLDLMFFFTGGIVWTYDQNFYSSDLDGKKDDSSNSIIRIKNLYKGDFYGEELLEWTLRRFTGGFGVPISTTDVKTHTKVEALVLMHKDLRSIVKKHWHVFSKLKPTPKYKYHKLIQHLAATLTQRTFKRCRINGLYIHQY